jgi:hypothetical protein
MLFHLRLFSTILSYFEYFMLFLAISFYICGYYKLFLFILCYFILSFFDYITYCWLFLAIESYFTLCSYWLFYCHLFH